MDAIENFDQQHRIELILTVIATIFFIATWHPSIDKFLNQSLYLAILIRIVLVVIAVGSFIPLIELV